MCSATPDCKGVWLSDAPDRRQFRLTRLRNPLAKAINSFTQSISSERFAIYVFDYGDQ